MSEIEMNVIEWLSSAISEAEADKVDDIVHSQETGERVDLWGYELSIPLEKAKNILVVLSSAGGTNATKELLTAAKEAAIRKAGQVVIDDLIDRGGWCIASNDDLADYMTRIVDACVRAAREAKP